MTCFGCKDLQGCPKFGIFTVYFCKRRGYETAIGFECPLGIFSPVRCLYYTVEYDTGPGVWSRLMKWPEGAIA